MIERVNLVSKTKKKYRGVGDRVVQLSVQNNRKKYTKRGRDDRVVQLSLQIDKNKNRGGGDRVLQFSIQKKKSYLWLQDQATLRHM